MPVPPPNAYAPGSRLTVGSHNITIIKYISEGGFAHVYTCNIEPPFQGSTVACLKRVAVPSKWQLTLLRQEVDAMRRLRGNKHIVSYIDSHASRMSSTTPEQQYEVFLLMEYCEKNGLIDFMNARLVHKLTEQEILTIMYEITIGVAMCHHLNPPLIHRDIKIENVLIDAKGTYKLCDFGSAVKYIPAPKTPQELALIRDDVMQHTTPQYRAPEMIDLTKGFPIDDKLDIWALGCFLYKLCYYTTPFELSSHLSLQDMEQLILNCSHTLRFNDQPGLMFSSRMKNIIKCCLREDPRRRPSGVQLLGEIASMRGAKVPNVVPYSVLEHQSKAQLKEDAPKLPSRPSKELSIPAIAIANQHSNKGNDPFASIDKSKFVNSTLTRSKSTYGNGERKPSRPVSVYNEETKPLYSSLNKSSTSIKDFVQKQLRKSDEFPPEKHTTSGNTLDFLRSKDDEYKLNSRQDTGGSFKSLKYNLRKISTGGSSIHSANNTGNNNIKHNKRSSISSIKQLLTGGTSRKTSYNYDEPVEESPEKPKKLSIQRRMQILLNNESEPQKPKTALGYGKYTDNKEADDIDAINAPVSRSISPSRAKPPSTERGVLSRSHSTHQKSKFLAPPQVPTSLSAKDAQKAPITKLQTVTTLKYEPNSKPRIVPPGKKVPPKPKKPVYLKSPEKHHIHEHERKLSNASEVSLPDLDDLEKQFSKRFPSYV